MGPLPPYDDSEEPSSLEVCVPTLDYQTDLDTGQQTTGGGPSAGEYGADDMFGHKQKQSLEPSLAEVMSRVPMSLVECTTGNRQAGFIGSYRKRFSENITFSLGSSPNEDLMKKKERLLNSRKVMKKDKNKLKQGRVEKSCASDDAKLSLKNKVKDKQVVLGNR